MGDPHPTVSTSLLPMYNPDLGCVAGYMRKKPGKLSTHYWSRVNKWPQRWFWIPLDLHPSQNYQLYYLKHGGESKTGTGHSLQDVQRVYHLVNGKIERTGDTTFALHIPNGESLLLQCDSFSETNRWIATLAQVIHTADRRAESMGNAYIMANIHTNRPINLSKDDNNANRTWWDSLSMSSASQVAEPDESLSIVTEEACTNDNLDNTNNYNSNSINENAKIKKFVSNESGGSHEEDATVIAPLLGIDSDDISRSNTIDYDLQAMNNNKKQMIQDSLIYQTIDEPGEELVQELQDVHAALYPKQTEETQYHAVDNQSLLCNSHDRDFYDEIQPLLPPNTDDSINNVGKSDTSNVGMVNNILQIDESLQSITQTVSSMLNNIIQETLTEVADEYIPLHVDTDMHPNKIDDQHQTSELSPLPSIGNTELMSPYLDALTEEEKQLQTLPIQSPSIIYGGKSSTSDTSDASKNETDPIIDNPINVEQIIATVFEDPNPISDNNTNVDMNIDMHNTPEKREDVYFSDDDHHMPLTAQGTDKYFTMPVTNTTGNHEEHSNKVYVCDRKTNLCMWVDANDLDVASVGNQLLFEGGLQWQTNNVTENDNKYNDMQNNNNNNNNNNNISNINNNINNDINNNSVDSKNIDNKTIDQNNIETTTMENKEHIDMEIPRSPPSSPLFPTTVTTTKLHDELMDTEMPSLEDLLTISDTFTNNNTDQHNHMDINHNLMNTTEKADVSSHPSESASSECSVESIAGSPTIIQPVDIKESEDNDDIARKNLHREKSAMDSESYEFVDKNMINDTTVNNKEEQQSHEDENEVMDIYLQHLSSNNNPINNNNNNNNSEKQQHKDTDESINLQETQDVWETYLPLFAIANTVYNWLPISAQKATYFSIYMLGLAFMMLIHILQKVCKLVWCLYLIGYHFGMYCVIQLGEQDAMWAIFSHPSDAHDDNSFLLNFHTNFIDHNSINTNTNINTNTLSTSKVERVNNNNNSSIKTALSKDDDSVQNIDVSLQSSML